MPVSDSSPLFTLEKHVDRYNTFITEIPDLTENALLGIECQTKSNDGARQARRLLCNID